MLYEVSSDIGKPSRIFFKQNETIFTSPKTIIIN